MKTKPPNGANEDLDVELAIQPVRRLSGQIALFAMFYNPDGGIFAGRSSHGHTHLLVCLKNEYPLPPELVDQFMRLTRRWRGMAHRLEILLERRADKPDRPGVCPDVEKPYAELPIKSDLPLSALIDLLHRQIAPYRHRGILLSWRQVNAQAAALSHLAAKAAALEHALERKLHMSATNATDGLIEPDLAPNVVEIGLYWERKKKRPSPIGRPPRGAA